MIMADIFKILFPIVATLMSFVCYCLLFEGTFPSAVKRCSQTYHTRPIRTIALGMFLGIPSVVLALAFLNSGNPLGQFLGFSMIFFVISTAILGAAGLAGLIGHRLNSPQDVHQPWKRVYRGSIVLAITFLFPVVGWFLVLPVTLLSGFGAALIALMGRKKQPSTSIDATAGPAQA